MSEIVIFEDGTAHGSGAPGEVRDPTAVRFGTDVEWLRRQGVMVTRYDLGRHPEAADSYPSVKEALAGDPECLPLAVVDGEIVSRGEYPSRQLLTERLGLHMEAAERVLSPAVKEIIGLGVASVANDEDSFLYYFRRARRLGVPDDELFEAVVTALVASDVPAREVMERSKHLMVDVAGVAPPSRPMSCCC